MRLYRKEFDVHFYIHGEYHKDVFKKRHEYIQGLTIIAKKVTDIDEIRIAHEQKTNYFFILKNSVIFHINDPQDINKISTRPGEIVSSKL